MEKPNSLIADVRRYIERSGLLQKGDKILIACSGGADSVVLTEVLRLLAPVFDWKIVVCHINHNIRGREAQEDALWVANFCRMRGLDCVVEEVNVPKFVSEKGYSTEEAARILRYQALNKVLTENGLSVIAVAHNMEDNAETVLMNVLRGTGLDGMTGIKAKIGNIIRPFLEVRRVDIERFCRKNKISYRTDSTNKNKKYLRNKVRMELLPQLTRYNPEIVPALCRMSSLMEKDADFLGSLAKKTYRKIAMEKEDSVALSLIELKDMGEALVSRIFIIAMKTVLKDAPKVYIEYKHVEKLIALLKENKTGFYIELPGRLKVKKEYEEIVFTLKNAGDKEKADFGEYLLPVPGRVTLPDGTMVRASVFRGSKPPVRGSKIAVFPMSDVYGPLRIRTRIAGDVFAPLGMNGQKKKLKEFFIDTKIPHDIRDDIPLVCDDKGILWVTGIRAGHRTAKLESEAWLYLELMEKRTDEDV